MVSEIVGVEEPSEVTVVSVEVPSEEVKVVCVEVGEPSEEVVVSV